MRKTDMLDKYLVPDNSQIYWKLVDGEVIFIAKRQRKMFDLNATGNLIWQEAIKKKRIGEIIDTVAYAYGDAPRHVVQKDVVEFITRLIQRKIFLLKEKNRMRRSYEQKQKREAQ